MPNAAVPRQPHPTGLYLLSTTEMWERFSFYGMKALLFIYVTGAVAAGGLGWSDEAGGWLMGIYSGLVYLTPIFGGYLADRYLGTHRSMVIGGYIIAAGHFVLAVETRWSLFVGLALVIIGTGFFKSTVSAMVGQLYAPADSRRDSAFTIFYMGINLGALLAPLVCGYLRVQYGWRYGFAAAGVGMVIGQLGYLLLRPRHLRGIGEAPERREANAAGGAAAATAPLTRDERRRIIAILIITFMVIIFWCAFEQASTSLTSFARARTDLTVASWLSWAVPGPREPGAAPAIPVEWFQSINPFFIVLLAPLFAMLWTALARRGIEPSVPVRMGCGMLIAAAGYVLMVFAAQLSEPDAGGVIRRVSPLWLIGAYLMASCGELCLSPVGLAMISKVSPARCVSLLMGVWFCAIFVGFFAAGVIGGSVERIAQAGFVLPGQAGFFLLFVIGPGAAGLLMLLLAPLIRRLMGDRA